MMASYIRLPPRVLQLWKTLQARAWRASHVRRVPAYQRGLAEIFHQHSGTEQVLIFPPGLGWNMQLFQRPQQLAWALSRQSGVLVFYIEPPESPRPAGFEAHQDGLYLCHVPVETFRMVPSPLVHTFTWNCRQLINFDRPRVIYDIVDDLGAFEGDPERLASDHHSLLHSAERVLVTAERLYRQVLPIRPDALQVPNGVDYGHFARPMDAMGPPAELVPIWKAGKPVVGYYGALARWFDYGLMAAVARQRRDLSFVLIGPDHDRSLARSGLVSHPNVHWLGPRPYADLPRYLACFDVATIPFQVNPITHATSPVKLFEYMAAGKPVVVTPMEESARYPGVLVGEGAQAFSEQLDRALDLRHDPEYLARIDAEARANTWEARARQILTSLGPEK